MATQNYIHPNCVYLFLFLCFFVACTAPPSLPQEKEPPLLLGSAAPDSLPQKTSPSQKATPHHTSEELVAAAQIHDISVIKKILKKHHKQLDINHQDQYQKTALLYAIEYGDLALIKQLLATGADVNNYHPTLGSPIFVLIGRHWGKERYVFEEDKMEDAKQDIAILDELLKNGADLSACLTSYHTNCIACPEDITPLHYAVYTSNYPLARRLIQKGAEIDVINNKEQTPLHFATIFEDLDNMDLLLRNGANPNAQDHLGLTPLHYAAQWGKAMATEKLIDYHANVNIKDVRDRTPLHHTLLNYTMRSQWDKIFVIELLLENQANVYLQDRARTSFINLAKGVRKKYPYADISDVLDEKVLNKLEQIEGLRIAYILYDENGNMQYVYEGQEENPIKAESEETAIHGTTIGTFVPSTTEGVGNPDIFNHIGISKETYKKPVSNTRYAPN